MPINTNIEEITLLTKQLKENSQQHSPRHPSEHNEMRIPRDENGNLLSYGSVYHTIGMCQPCLYHPSRTCNFQTKCLYCHYEHNEEWFQKKGTSSLSATMRERQEALMFIDPTYGTAMIDDADIQSDLHCFLSHTPSYEAKILETNVDNDGVDENQLFDTQSFTALNVQEPPSAKSDSNGLHNLSTFFHLR